MKPTQPRGSPARTGARSSLVRDPGAKDFQEFSQDPTTNEKEPKKKTTVAYGKWESTQDVDSHSLGKACGLTTFPHRPGDEQQGYGRI